MGAFAGDADEPAEEGYRAPLPAEDRLWRHPSELGAANSIALDPASARRKWLARPPSRASAWTAGIVGAILATGLVAVGSHLVSAFHPAVTATETSNTLASAPLHPPLASSVGPELAASIRKAGASVAVVDIVHGAVDKSCLGVVVRQNGMIAVPAMSVAGATTLTVTFADAVPYVARLVASDRRSGIAILHVNGIDNLPVPQLGSTGMLDDRSFALAVTAPGGTSFALGTLTTMDTTASVGGVRLSDVLDSDVPASKAPAGSAVVDTTGALVGMVAGDANGSAVIVPSWVLAPVVSQLLSGGAVHHGWLGVSGNTVTASGFRPAGVLLTRVVPGSAAGVAGLRAGDIITSVNFQPITSMTGLVGHLYGIASGQQILIGIDRGTTDLFYRVVLQSDRAASH